VFNILGPLTNPAGAHAQVLGVASPALVQRMAEALALLGSHHALVVHGEDGVDEVSICAPTRVSEVRDGEIRSYSIAPEDFGFTRGTPEAIQGGDAAANAAISRSVLSGADGPRREVVLMNAAAALVASDLADDLADGVRLAAQAIDSGAAAERLEKLASVTRRFA